MPRIGLVSVGAIAGAMAAGAESLRPSLTPRSTVHQTLVTAAMASTGALVGSALGAALQQRNTKSRPAVRAGVLGSGAIVAVVRGSKHAKAQAASFPEWGHVDGNDFLGVGAGTAAALSVTATSRIAIAGVGVSGRALSRRFVGPSWIWNAMVGAAVVTGTAASGRLAMKRLKSSLSENGREADKALVDAPDDRYVTGGPGSLVEYNSLAREGRRFVHWRVSAEELAAAGESEAKEPLRVFIGYDSSETLAGRVDLAMAELERLNAFERKHLLAICPAGSGYANSVPVEAMEFFTSGDCASVVVQYGLLPSMFSLNLIPDAADGYRLLLDRIRQRIAAMPSEDRPSLHLYGESLGANIAQVALERNPALADADRTTITDVDSVLFVGSPGGTHLRDELADNPQVVHVDRWQDLPANPPAGCQFWFLDHDADPVTRFQMALARRQPHWLSHEPRGRNIPADMKWFPILTWQQVLLDVAYATQAQSGVFRSLGHDYRADLTPLVAAAYRPTQADRVINVQGILVKREVARDKLLADAER